MLLGPQPEIDQFQVFAEWMVKLQLISNPTFQFNL